jgi:hypothetical protein
VRVITTGGRKHDDSATVCEALFPVPRDAILVHGNAPGWDRLAAAVWRAWGGVDEPHPADWDGPCRETCAPHHRRFRFRGSDYCPAAGNYRNQEMADLGADECVAGPGGSGTRDMVRRAKAAGIPVREVS